MDLRLKATK